MSSEQPQEPSRQSFSETAKDALSMAAEKAREMAQYATGAVFNATENVKETATGNEQSVSADEPIKDKKLQQPCKFPPFLYSTPLRTTEL